MYSECEQNCPVSLKADKLVVFPKKNFLNLHLLMNVLFALNKRASKIYLHNFSVKCVPIDIHKFSHPKCLLKNHSVLFY